MWVPVHCWCAGLGLAGVPCFLCLCARVPERASAWRGDPFEACGWAVHTAKVG